MAKILKRLVLLTFVAVLMFPTAAMAGIDKKLVEIDAEERARLERERIAEQEAYEAEAKRQAELERLEREKAERLLAAKNLREEQIDQRNDLYSSLHQECTDDGKKDCFADHCGFFCTLWRIITFPVRLVYRAVS